MHKGQFCHVPEINYLSWFFKHNEKVKYDIGVSNIRTFSPEELNINLSKIELRVPHLEEIIEVTAKTFNISLKNVLVTLGTTASYSLICSILIKNSDEVIIETPTYEPLVRIPEHIGAKIVRLERKFEEDYKISSERLKKLINKRTKLIVITKLHNPTGIGVTKEEFQELKNLTGYFDGYIFMNEVYAPLLDDELSKPTFLISKRIISASSFAKSYGLGGLQMGWVFADERIIKEASKLRYYFGYAVSHPAQSIAFQILPKLNFVRNKARNVAKNNWDILENWLKNHADYVEYVAPSDGVICFPRFKKRINVSKFVDKLISKYSTRIIPGKFFGAKNHIRIGFGCEEDILVNGLKRLSYLLKEIR